MLMPMPMPSSAVDFVMYGVRDLPQAVAFYHETLGLPVEGEFPEFRWVEFAAGNVTLAVTEVPGTSIHRLADGRIVESWVQGNDSLPLLQQLGALPEAEPAPRR